ncbi:hypothetical protein JNP96_16570 [Escherichia coli]|uniref:Uncharacterized protein n=2 Tax=Escherichia coli TaxID=562 RepID=A0A895NLW7_ECOLX|nr:hypothetical protein JNP96_16570 [Escherichia coli]
MFALKLTDERGREWISPVAPPLNLVRSFHFTLSARDAVMQFIDTGVPTNYRCVIFIKQISGNQSFHGEMVQLNGTWQYDIFSAGTGQEPGMEQDSTYVVYVFANMVNVWPQWGIQLCDSHGRVVWNTEMLPLEVKMTRIWEKDVPISVGHDVAVMPGCTQWTTVQEGESYYWYTASFNARNSQLWRQSTFAEDNVAAPNDNSGVVNNLCYYINAEIYDAY